MLVTGDFLFSGLFSVKMSLCWKMRVDEHFLQGFCGSRDMAELSVSQVGGSIATSSSLHVKVSLCKIPNPRLPRYIRLSANVSLQKALRHRIKHFMNVGV